MEEEPNTYHIKLGSGIALVAKPDLLDPNFFLTVTLLCSHDEEGSMGLVLNRPTNFFIDIENFELVDEAHSEHCYPVCVGGPVQPEALFYLFRYKGARAIEGVQLITENIYLASHPEPLKELKNRGLLNPKDVRFFIGYAGWSFYQLDCESSLGAWHAHPCNERYIFDTEHENLWTQIMSDLGPTFKKQADDFLGELD